MNKYLCSATTERQHRCLHCDSSEKDMTAVFDKCNCAMYITGAPHKVVPTTRLHTMSKTSPHSHRSTEPAETPLIPLPSVLTNELMMRDLSKFLYFIYLFSTTSRSEQTSTMRDVHDPEKPKEISGSEKTKTILG